MSDSLSLSFSETISSTATVSAGQAALPTITLEQCDWHFFDRRDQIAQWDTLSQWATQPNPFYESWFLLPSLRTHAQDGSIGLLALRSDGQLAGLMPVQTGNDYYGRPIPHIANWVHPNCFLGLPLVARGFEKAFWRAVIEHCDEESGLSLFLHLAQMPSTGPLHDALVTVLAEQDRAAATVLTTERAMLASDQNKDDYFAASLSTKKRKELRRQHRRLAEEGELVVERLSGLDEVSRWSREFLDLEARGWKGKADSALDSDNKTAMLFISALAGAAARGKLERLCLRLDGKPIAMLATFLSDNGAFSFKTTFDESYSRFSPGVLLQCENLELLNREGVDWVDSCAAEDHPMIDHIWRERRTISHHSIAIGGTFRRAAFAAMARLETGKPAGGIT